ncbi:phBC6A51 family helix-turn-helix protein [Alicyclobacillus kakegawensis]|uniref:phBC6A51 family helix-turn-helix protein n=1 Tax=Alicyclobacillus kakegawensis TaxID=392012 RepID=UPI00082A3161|nr:phBC6A51 family helix-turn-helix protein [Alicyclobacillus kakegawensis]
MTKAVKTRQLSVEQENAIDLLLMGKSDREVAEAVSVARQTVWEWRNRNAEFMAELNARRQELWGAQVERMRQLVAKAVDVLEEDLHQGADAKLRQSAAVHILRAVGLYGADLKPSGPTQPNDVKNALERDEFMRELMAQLS